MLEVLVAKFPESAPGIHEISRTKLRMKEQQTGTYDWQKLYKESNLRPPKIDCATFTGPIEVRQCDHGKGLFTTKAVQAAQLLLCEKVFSYCFATPTEETLKAKSKSMSPASVLIDVPGNRTSFGTQPDIIRDISIKLIMAPLFKDDFENLFHGSYESAPSTLVDRSAVVDT